MKRPAPRVFRRPSSHVDRQALGAARFSRHVDLPPLVADAPATRANRRVATCLADGAAARQPAHLDGAAVRAVRGGARPVPRGSTADRGRRRPGHRRRLGGARRHRASHGGADPPAQDEAAPDEGAPRETTPREGGSRERSGEESPREDRSSPSEDQQPEQTAPPSAAQPDEDAPRSGEGSEAEPTP
jgi:hypothetical protein